MEDDGQVIRTERREALTPSMEQRGADVVGSSEVGHPLVGSLAVVFMLQSDIYWETARDSKYSSPLALASSLSVSECYVL